LSVSAYNFTIEQGADLTRMIIVCTDATETFPLDLTNSTERRITLEHARRVTKATAKPSRDAGWSHYV